MNNIYLQKNKILNIFQKSDLKQFKISDFENELNFKIISFENEIELLQIIDKIFVEHNLEVIIKINNVKLLSGIAERIGFPEYNKELISTLYKLNKIGLDNFKEELMRIGFSEDSVNLTETILNLNGTYNNQMQCIEKFLGETDSGIDGIVEIEKLFSFPKIKQFKNEIQLDITLSTNENSFSGTIFKIALKENQNNILCKGGTSKDFFKIYFKTNEV